MDRPVIQKSLSGTCMVLALMLCIAGDLFAANKAKIDEAILKGQKYILAQNMSGPHASLAVLAYMKSGGSKKAAAVQQIVAEILSKTKTGIYVPLQHHNYEAGVDLMTLEAMDDDDYLPAMQLMVNYLLKNQQPNGAWYYPEKLEGDCGDTSITQYAILGLWAAVRAGLEVPVEVWEKAALWHISRQREDGGFAYHPFTPAKNEYPEYALSTGNMSAAGSSNLLIIRRILFDDVVIDAEVRPADARRRFGVLERFADEKLDQKRQTKGVVTLRPEKIDKSLKESVRWITSHYKDKGGTRDRIFCYYLYCIERVAALMDVEKIGSHDWYDDGADELLLKQLPDGSWNDECTNLSSTSLALMFLSKATTTIVTPKKKIATVGGGLQIGGRGLPDKLDAVQMKDGTVSARKVVSPVDNLLIELERSADAKVEDAQAAVVDAVQLDRPQDLIGQMARLRKLATDSRVEVRRTALWAMGRSGEISAVPWLIEGLMDPDMTVTREASLGLCILSRLPEGVGKLAIDPNDDGQMGLKDNATEEDRQKVIEKWRDNAKKHWTEWYQKNRPYDERDDRTGLRPTKK